MALLAPGQPARSVNDVGEVCRCRHAIAAGNGPSNDNRTGPFGAFANLITTECVASLLSPKHQPMRLE